VDFMKTKNSTFTLRLEADLLAAIAAASEAERKPAAQIVREALKAHLKRLCKTKDCKAILQTHFKQ